MSSPAPFGVARGAVLIPDEITSKGPQAQSFLYVFFFGFRFVARRAQPAIPEESSKTFGRSSGIVLVNAANSKALDHLLFRFGSNPGKVASISVLIGLVPFLWGDIKILDHTTRHSL
jgi:hypothetical protein